MTSQILVVAESAEAAQAIVQRLGGEFDGAVAISTGPLLAIISAATETRARVVLLGLGTVAASERVARALRDAPGSAPPPLILVLCSAGELAAANRLAGDGVFDHYLPHPDEFDPGRLAISARLGLRLAGAAPATAGAAPAGTVAAPAAKAPPRPRPVLLMVEDDQFTHQLVAVTLASQDVDLVFESDGAGAIDRIRAVRPDLVLMDVVLPGRDGVELTHGLKSDPDLASIPVVMVTGEARREVLVRSMEAGAADFLVKPFTPDALVAKLTRFLPALR
jgi:CheY-like chemotaxis protein